MIVSDLLLFLIVPWMVCLQCMIVVFSDHTHYFAAPSFRFISISLGTEHLFVNQTLGLPHNNGVVWN